MAAVRGNDAMTRALLVAVALHAVGIALLLVREQAPRERDDPDAAHRANGSGRTADEPLPGEWSIAIVSEPEEPDTAQAPQGEPSLAGSPPHASPPREVRGAPSSSASVAHEPRPIGAEAAAPGGGAGGRDAPGWSPRLFADGETNRRAFGVERVPLATLSTARDEVQGAGSVDDARRRLERSLSEAARDRERDLGLGPEGPVLTALASATAASLAPVRGRAVLVAEVDASGAVESVRVEESDGDRAGWDDAAHIALGALAGKRLKQPPKTQHASLRIELTSDWKLPSGHDPGTEVRVLGLPLSKGEGKQSTRVEILPLPKLRVDVVEIAPGLKLPIASLQIGLFGTDADPAEVGAKARRIVHARLLGSTFE